MTDLIHGRASTYNNHKCRCEHCTKAWAEYMRPRIKKYRAGVKEQSKKGVNIRL